LVAAARELVYRQGVEPTTLADIAQVADVRLGNVYYYFKTKDDIVAAVVQAQRLERSTRSQCRRTLLKTTRKVHPGVTDLAAFAELVPLDHGLCVINTLRGDGSIQSSVVNAGLLEHPLRVRRADRGACGSRRWRRARRPALRSTS
jgi:AcrR family transcriptional regulator